jgi:hypothetical protein
MLLSEQDPEATMAFLGGPRRRVSSYGPQPIRLNDRPPGPPPRPKKDKRKPAHQARTGPLSATNLTRAAAVIMGLAVVVVVILVVLTLAMRH